MSSLGYRGITINDHVNGVTFDDPRFYPFWEAVESLGAVVFFHQCGPTLVKARTTRYALPNSIGNLVDRAVTFGTLVFGGIMDRYPDLKICLGHAGGTHHSESRGWTRPGARRHRGARIRRRQAPEATKRVPGPVLLRLLHLH